MVAAGGGKTRSSLPAAAAAAPAKAGGGGGGSRGAGGGGARGYYTYTPGTCCVCDKKHVSPHNAIVFCSVCNACYHQACYRKGRNSALRYVVPPGFWRCGETSTCRSPPKATAAAWEAKLIKLAEDEHAVAMSCGLDW